VIGFDRTLIVVTGRYPHPHATIRSGGHWSKYDPSELVDFDGYFGLHNPNTFAAAPELLDACKSMIPSNMSLGNKNIPDHMTVPLETTMGDLRKIAAAIAKATAAVP
jgi:hypothetical protein